MKKDSLPVTDLSPVRLGLKSPYFHLAEAALTYAQNHILKSGTQLTNNQESSENFSLLSNLIDDIRKDMDIISNFRLILMSARGTTITADILAGVSIDAAIEIIKKFLIGNCAESGLLVLDFFYIYKHKLNEFLQNYPIFCEKLGLSPVSPDDKKFDALVETCHIRDHIFAVIGRKPDSDPNDITTWGDDALICDPWANKIYPVADIGDHLFDFVGITSGPASRKKANFELKKFNVEKDKLFIENSLLQLELARRHLSADFFKSEKLSTRLSTAIEQKKLKSAKKWIEAGAMWKKSDYPKLPELRNELVSQLFTAVERSDEKLINRLLMIDNDLVNSVNEKGNSLLIEAALSNNHRMITSLLRADADLFITNKKGFSVFEVIKFPSYRRPDLFSVDNSQINKELINENLWHLVQKKLLLPDNKLHAQESKNLNSLDSLANYLKNYNDQAKKIFTDMAIGFIRNLELSYAAKIFSAFPEIALDPQIFINNHFNYTRCDLSALTVDFSGIIGDTQISDEVKFSIKKTVFNYGLWHNQELCGSFIKLFSAQITLFLNLQDNNGDSALHIAVKNNNIKVLKFLLKQNNPDSKPLNLFLFNKAGKMPYEMSGISKEAKELLTTAMTQPSTWQPSPGRSSGSSSSSASSQCDLFSSSSPTRSFLNLECNGTILSSSIL